MEGGGGVLSVVMMCSGFNSGYELLSDVAVSVYSVVSLIHFLFCLSSLSCVMFVYVHICVCLLSLIHI